MTTTPPVPEWLKPFEVAELFRVHPRTITRWRLKGRLKDVHMAQTLGGWWRYSKEDILRLRASL